MSEINLRLEPKNSLLAEAFAKDPSEFTAAMNNLRLVGKFKGNLR